MFPDRGQSFNGLKHLTEKVTAACGCSDSHVRVVVDDTMSTPLQRLTKLKIFWSVSSPHQDFIFCQKHLQQAYFYVIFNSHPFKEMFIVSGIVTTLLPPVNTASSKEYLRKIQIILCCGVQSCTAIHRVPRWRMGERPLDIEVSCEISGLRPDE